MYLDVLDKYIKSDIKCRYYLRYMDDFLIFTKDKKEANLILKKIKEFLIEYLKLELNHKSRIYPMEQGVNFCGYQIFKTHKLLRRDSKKKINKNVIKWNKEFRDKSLDRKKAFASYRSWVSHAKHCNSYNIRMKIENSLEFIYTDNIAYMLYIDSFKK